MLGDARERGQTTAETAVLVGLCAVLLIVALIFFGGRIADRFEASGEAASGEFRPPVALCDTHYSGGCVPPYPPAVDCSDLQSLGVGPVTVNGSDPHGLDPDGDGVACD